MDEYTPLDGHPPVHRPDPTGGGRTRDAETGAERPGLLRRLVLGLGMALFLLSSFVPFALRGLGNWLIVEDELQAADVIFIHAGPLPFRSMEAGDIYRDGRAREVWLAPIRSTAESRALQELGIERPPGHYWRSLVLQRKGVPRDAIRMLPHAVLNTQDEVVGVVNELLERDLSSAILVTSKQHSRRVRMLWDRVAPGELTAIVRPSQSDPFDPNGWWRNTEDGQAALHELAGIAAIWLRLGIRPERD